MNRQETLVKEYTAKIKPILKMAQSARGARSLDTPAHEASRKYTELLVQFSEDHGSLPMLAKSLGVSYAGLHRRIRLKDVSVMDIPDRKEKKTDAETAWAVIRVLQAKLEGLDEYHDQLAKEYQDGYSLNRIAKVMGLSSASPLYYAVERSLQKKRKKTAA